MRIINHAQQRAEHLDLGRLQHVTAAVTHARDVPPRERGAVQVRHIPRRAEQNHNVVRRDRARARAVGDGCFFCQQPLDARGNKLRLLRVFLRRFVVQRRGVIQRDAVQLDLRLRRIRERTRAAQRLLLGVVQLPSLAAHHERKYVVHAVHDLLSGTEIIAEQNFTRLSRNCIRMIYITIVFFKEDPRVSQPEAVDRLLHVANHKAVFAVLRHRLKNTLLHGVGVLILVHENLAIPRGDLPRRRRRQRCAALREQADALVLQIGKIQQLAAAFFLRVPRVKAAQYLHQPTRGGAGALKIAQHCLRRRVKPCLRLANARQTRLAALLHTLLQRRVFYFSCLRERTKAHGRLRRKLVPCGKRKLRGDALQVLRERRRVFFRQHGVVLHLLQRPRKRSLCAL